MKIAISATGRTIESNIGATFGRAPLFLIRDTTTKDVKVIENKARGRQSGIGITAVNTVVNEGIDAVITADIGPKAFEIFKQGRVQIYKADDKIEDAIKLFEEKKLSEITNETVPRYSGKLKKEETQEVDWDRVEYTQKIQRVRCKGIAIKKIYRDTGVEIFCKNFIMIDGVPTCKIVNDRCMHYSTIV